MSATGDVVVPRAALRGMRSLVGGVVVGVVGLIIALALMAVDSQERCDAGNQLRREDLPAAFAEFGSFLGEEFGADQDRVDDANARFAGRLDELFPERDCALLP